jgi:uncharacterized protein YndB with AHSA1/START domain
MPASTRIHNAIHIARSIEEVFDFVTTPGHWARWHPATRSVRGATDHSLLVGEQVVEEFTTMGRSATATWVVREREAPQRWVIEGTTPQGGRATITYTLKPDTGGTIFERELAYSKPGLFFALMNRLVGRRRMQAESAHALERLKNHMETEPP